MKPFSFLLLSLVLVGAGCTTTVSDTKSNDTTVTADNAMLVPEEEGDDMIVEEEGIVTEDEDAETGTDEMIVAEEENKNEVKINVDAEVTTSEVAPDAVVLNLDGFMFGYSQTELRVKQGQTVTVNMTSTNGFHDFVVDEFNAATGKVNTGGVTSVTFVADKAGTFEYYCSVGQHRASGMTGKLIVE